MQTGSSQEDRSGTPRTQRPIRSIQRKLALWTLVLVTVPTFLCALWLSNITASAMQQRHAQHVAMIGQTLASSLSGRITNGWTKAAGHVLNALAVDPRLAFVIVTDPDERVWQRRTIDADAWTRYEQWSTQAGRRLVTELDRPIDLGEAGELIVQKVPIWNPPDRPTRSDLDTAEPRSLEGFVVVALLEPDLRQTLGRLRASQVMAACLICFLSLPIVLWAIRRWTAPLRTLLHATIRLGAGEDAPQVRIESNDELGRLGEAFNEMATNLAQARGQLQHANQRLEVKVRRRTRELQVVNEKLELAVSQLKRLAATDPLTGLANRRTIRDALKRSFAECNRYGHDLACIMIDLDGFKQVNDTLGHQRGDDLLQCAARILEKSCRQSDIAGRFGGDEFILLLPETDVTTACQVARRIGERFRGESADLCADGTINGLTMSIGLATLRLSAPTCPEQLIAQADQALYGAKQAGKRCYMVFDPRGEQSLDVAARIGAAA